MGKSKIEWTDVTWNPLRGCTRVSEGCRNCYAEAVAARFSGPGQAYEGIARMTANGGRWTGKVRLIEEVLKQPLHWKKPRMVFVNSMSDLFHESVPDHWIDRIFAVMAQTPQHAYQVLTKRPGRMRDYLRSILPCKAASGFMTPGGVEPKGYGGSATVVFSKRAWPLPNVWLGTSVEDQATADGRIPQLLATPAAIRFVSYEPALGPVRFDDIVPATDARYSALPHLDWIIVGGESGPRARPFDLAWARSTIEQCRAAGVPVFVKQLGADVVFDPKYDLHLFLRDRKGGDPAEWPDDLRVREWPVQEVAV